MTSDALGDDLKMALIDAAVRIEREMKSYQGSWRDRPIGAPLNQLYQLLGLWADAKDLPTSVRVSLKRDLQVVEQVLVEIERAVEADRIERITNRAR